MQQLDDRLDPLAVKDQSLMRPVDEPRDVGLELVACEARAAEGWPINRGANQLLGAVCGLAKGKVESQKYGVGRLAKSSTSQSAAGCRLRTGKGQKASTRHQNQRVISRE